MDNSVWRKLEDASSLYEAILAEEKMVRALEKAMEWVKKEGEIE